MNSSEYDDWAMERAGERARRRRQWMVGLLLFALLASIVIPVVHAFT